jgi:hypothetical protein
LDIVEEDKTRLRRLHMKEPVEVVQCENRMRVVKAD